ncbi:MAG: beta strand repeat-containing protein, partial [Terrimicrobiaceae bacterium]
MPRNAGLNSQPWSLRTVPLQVDSDGGTLVLAGSQMLFTDATLLGRAGGPTAVGGTLEVSSGRPEDPLQRFGSDINLVVAQTNDSFPRGTDKTGIGRPIRDHLGVLVPQMGYFAADDFLAGGFDSLDLGMSQGAAGTARGGNVQFYGPVKIEARGSLRVASGGIIRADSAVSLKAPYIAVGQIFRAPVNPVENLENPFYPFQKFENGGPGPESVLPEFGPGSLTLTADVIDVGTLVLKNIGQASFSAPGGDIRGNGTLSIAGDLTLNAAQIYPTTYSAFNIFAYDHAGVQGSVTVKRSGQAAAPLSAAGSLNIYASIINQGGVLLAPFGSITLGWDGTDLDPTDPNVFGPVNPAALDGNTPVAKKVTLKSGSLTSVAGIDYSSDQGLLIPFGNSPDGLSVIDPRGVNVTASGLPQKSIAVAGNNVVTEENSLIDIRGGGDLFATQWIPGIGGQVDLLGSASGDWSATTDYAAGDLVTSGGETWSARVAINVADFASGQGPTPSVSKYWTRVAESYAVVPGYGSRIAPHAPFNTGINATSLGGDPGYISTNLRVGDRVYLDGGSGLPAGEYTLLPRRYALLPGAFLVTPQDSGPVGTYSVAEGTTFVTGYQLNGLNRPSTLSPLRDRFEVAPARVVANRAEYATYGLNSFLTAAAVRLDLTEVQRLPIDSGYLLLHGNSGLNLAGRVLSPAPEGGRGALIDISSFADITIVGPGQSAKGNAVLNAETLSGFGAESLLIGGIRRSNLLGTSVEVRTSRLVLNNAGAPLTGPEITLVSQRELTLAPGSQLLVSGRKTEPSDALRIDGNGVAIRVSADETASIHRSNVTGSNLPLLTIGSGAQIEGPSLTLDSSYGFNLASDARIDARTLTLGAGQISLLLAGPTALTGQITNPQLVLTGNVLQDVQSVSSLSLLAYQTSIDLYGPGTFGGAGLKYLSLVAPEIRGFNQGGGSTTFTAGDVFLSNARGVTPPGPSAAPAGSLIFDTNTVTIGGGNLNVSQYENLILNAAGGVSLEGTGGLFAQRNMTINTPLVVAAQGARQNLAAGGTLDLNKTGGSAAVLGGLGASLTLRGTSVGVLSDILLPSGLLEIRATGPGGDVLVGGNIDLSGRATKFYDLSRYTDGGELRLISESGDVSLLADSSVSVAADAGGGNAGKIAVQAVQGQFSALGEFLGQAGVDGKGGLFELDTLQLASLDVLRDLLNAGGFTESRNLRVRTGNLTVAGTTVTRNYTLAADGGNIDVTGVIDASGLTGGNISLIARGNVTLQNGSILTVAAEEFSNAGKGGTVTLEAGSQLNGAVNPAGFVDIQTGSLIDLSVAEFVAGEYTTPGSSAFQGQFQGTLHIRAPRNAAQTDLQVNPINGTIVGASNIAIEGYRLYDLTDSGGILNTTLRAQISTDGQTFMGAAGTTTAGYTAMVNRLLANNAGLSSVAVITPGAELINSAAPAVLNYNLNTIGSTINVATTDGAVYFPAGTPGTTTIRSTVAGTITSASGVVTTLAANTNTAIAAGSSVRLNLAGTISYASGAGGPIAIGLTPGSAYTTSNTGVAGSVSARGSLVTLNTANTSSIALTAGTRVNFPTGTPGTSRIRSNVAGTITSATGVVTVLAANTNTAIAAGSYVTLNSAGTITSTVVSGGAIPVALASGSFTTSGPITATPASGDLTLGLANTAGNTNIEARSAADWDFSTFRFGPRRAPGFLTLRARGNIAFNNTLSDGFTPLASTSESGNSTMWLANLTPIDTDGLGQLYRPINLQSWSFKVTAGSDLAAVNSAATLNLGTPGVTGSIFVGEFYAPVPNSLTGAPSPAVGDNGLTSNSIRISTDATDRGTRFEVIRNGTGSITLNAARDVQLRNQFATVYTAGVRLPNPQNLFGINDFRTPDFPGSTANHPNQGGLGAVQQLYGPTANFGAGTRRIPQYSMAGGQVSLAAGQDIGRYSRVAIGGTPTIVKDSSRQLPGNWLYRRGYVDPDTGLFGAQVVPTTIVNDPSASTTWWIDYSNFFEGIGALGGGDVSVVAGRNIENIDAFTPTNARMAGRDALGNNIAPNADLLLELGGGDLNIVAGNNIDGGVYYVERGEGLLRAGGEITTNEARSPSFGYLKNSSVRDTAESMRWLPTTLYLGKGSFDVTASGNVLLGPVVNAFLMPQGLNNKFWYKTYFNTYGEDSSVSVTSIQGDVTHRMAVLTSGGASVSPLSLWLSTQNINIPGTSAASTSSAAFFQPWNRLSETSVTEFASIFSILPPKLYSTSISGDINLVGDMSLFPSPTGTLELAAAGSINALQPVGLTSDGRTAYINGSINVSDADPNSLYGITSPFAAFTTSKTVATLRTSQSGFLSTFRNSFTESGSFIAEEAGISRKQARHAQSVLHAADLEPVRLYANLGDISGLTLFTPKAAQIVAGADITDIAFYLQNATPDSVSIVSAGQDLIPFSENSALRTIANQGTNFIPGNGRVREDGSLTSALQGDIQISGEGVLEVLAGRNIDLGTSEGFSDGTGAGITSIGRSRNPFLPFDGARVIVLAGITGPDDGAALGLRGSSLDFDGFIDQFSAGGVAGLAGANQDLLDLLEDFESLTPEQQAIAALDVFFLQLRQAAADFNTTGSYEAGYNAIATLFGASSPAGEIFTRTRDIRTTSGGGITIGAPGGGMTMASTLPTASLTPPGV